MNKRLLLLFLLLNYTAYCQYNDRAPWIKELKKKNTSLNTSRDSKSAKQTFTFKEITTSFHEYWKDKEALKDQKGSGYKPFMRWENYWSHFVKPNGNLPTAKELWEVWERKQNGKGPVNPTSNWTSLGPVINGEIGIGLPGIGRINQMAVDPNNPNIWYAGAPSGGFWKSTDAGDSWISLFDDFPQIGVSGIAINPDDSNIILIATGDDDASDSFSAGVFKSIDGGSNWSQTSINPSNQNKFDTLNEIAYDPSNSSIAWVAGTDGLQKSIDGGDTWSVVLSGDITDFKLKPNDPNTIYAVSPNQYFKSTDGGAMFTEITDTLPTTGGRIVIGVTPADPDIVYLLFADTISRDSALLGLFKSTDSGETFAETTNTSNILESNQAWFDLAIAVSPTNPNEVYTGCLNIWKSADGGDTFTQLNQWFSNTPSYTHADIHTLKFFNNKLYAGTDGGLFVSEDGGATFDDHSDGLAVTQFYRIGIAKNDASRIVGGTQDNSGFVYNQNQWNVYTGGDGMDYEIDPTNSNIAYGFVQFGNPLFITNNLGETVGSISSPNNGSGPIEANWITPLAIDNQGTVFAAYDAVYKLVGSDWERVSDFFTTGNNPNPNGDDNIDDLEIDPNNPQIMYAVDRGLLYRSENGGVDFVVVNEVSTSGNPIPFDTQISDIAINSNNSNVVYLTTSNRVGIREAAQPSIRNVYRVTVDGNMFLSRENITFDLPNDQAFFCIVHQPRNTDNPIFVGTSLGVYRLDDTLTEWEEYSTGMPNTAVSDLEISVDDGVIVASTYGRGAWQSPIPIQLPNDDIKLISVSTNAGTITCNEVLTEVTVENKGLNDITQIDVTYNINGDGEQTFTVNEVITSEGTLSFDLPPLDASLGELSLLTVNVTIQNDAFDDNNSKQATVFIGNSAANANQIFDFENDTGSLNSFDTAGLLPTTNQSVWEIGTPTGTLLNTSFSGSQVVGTNLDGNYPDLTSGVVYSGCYDLSSIIAPQLSFQMAYDLEENWDIVYVVYSLDNGSTYEVLGELGSQPNWYNSNRTNASSGTADDCQNCPGAQWTGTNSTMTKYTYDFVANAGRGETDLTNAANIQFGIVFISDQSVNQEGVIIDDFVVEGFEDDEDDDNDGILDINDNCPLIANADQADNDNDGNGDVCDNDDDNDGILDIDDNCPFEPNADQEDGDNDGTGDVCDDDLDNDGVSNSLDTCPNTPANAVVDVNGCEIFSLPANNFSIKSTGESCTSTNNGSIAITAVSAQNYTATLTQNGANAVSLEFTETATFANLTAGSYTLCITVENQTGYEQCFNLSITEPEPLSVASKVNGLSNKLVLNLKGGKEYLVELNGEAYITKNSQIELPLTKIENLLSVRTDKECQGVYEETIVLTSKILVFPNPVENNDLNVYLGSNEFDEVTTSLFTTDGRQIMRKSHIASNGYIRIDMHNLPKGVYLLNVKTGNALLNYKILRK
ncbi:thrombospondin type 3 repeat-containing protein [uncultured Croceitalea sp.]|uniref:T9SS type A sorting domain-containing protein n=1 Tax=uncultured Croceitalea sp. TaxID=1798908 RepID=UPI003305B92D